MKRLLKNIMYLTMLCIVFSLSACGGNSEDEEKSSIEQFTSETAKKAVQHIQEPIDKARAVQVLADQHSKQVKQALGEQE